MPVGNERGPASAFGGTADLDRVAQILALAQETAGQFVADAQEKAAQIIAAAQAHAGRSPAAGTEPF